MNENTHSCLKEGELSRLSTNLNRLVEACDDPVTGISARLIRIEAQIEAIISTIELQTTTISALTKFMTETTAVSVYKVRTKDLSWKVAGIIISAIISFGGIVSSLIIKFA
jgi:hypothetical protein